MKHKIQVNPVNRETKIIASSLFLLIIYSCGFQKFEENTHLKDAYEVINLEEYGDRILYHETLAYSSLPDSGNNFSYENISNNNFDKNWVLETVKHVEFDTVFNASQREEINRKFKELETQKLNPSKLKNPKSLSKVEKGTYYQSEGLEGFIKLTYPFFVKGKDGQLFSFIYRSYYNEGILFIYKQMPYGWREWAKVPIWIS